MGKNVGLTYGEFKFPSEQGFTGSAGVNQVKGYQRGGRVRGATGFKGPSTPVVKGRVAPGKPTAPIVKGRVAPGKPTGPIVKGRVGRRKPTAPIVKGRVGRGKPAPVKGMRGFKEGGEVSMHDKLKAEGAKMGYAYGGRVKGMNTSAQFKQTRGKQATMDHGVQPAQKGRNQQEVEAGGNKRLKPGYKKGGGVCRVRMPKNVKAKGGLAKYAAGGLAKKAVAAQ